MPEPEPEIEETTPEPVPEPEVGETTPEPAPVAEETASESEPEETTDGPEQPDPTPPVRSEARARSAALHDSWQRRFRDEPAPDTQSLVAMMEP